MKDKIIFVLSVNFEKREVSEYLTCLATLEIARFLNFIFDFPEKICTICFWVRKIVKFNIFTRLFESGNTIGKKCKIILFKGLILSVTWFK